jgi:hypothetical protein
LVTGCPRTAPLTTTRSATAKKEGNLTHGSRIFVLICRSNQDRLILHAADQRWGHRHVSVSSQT